MPAINFSAFGVFSGKARPAGVIWNVYSAGDESRGIRGLAVLAGQMPAEYRNDRLSDHTRLMTPINVLTFARTTGATDFTRQMAEVAFASVARQTRKMHA